MGRKPTPIAAPETLPVLDAALIAEESQALTEVSMRNQLQSSSLEVGKLVGRLQSTLFLRHVADKMIAETFIQLRDGKKYKDLEIPDASGNLRTLQTLEDACDALIGKSYRTCAEIAQNFELLGDRIFDSAERLGLRAKDYRALRALPSDDLALIKTTIAEATDRDSVTDLIGELTERHAKKLAEKDKAIAELSKQVEVKERRVKALGEERDTLNEKLIGMTLTADASRKVALQKRDRALGELSTPQLPAIPRHSMCCRTPMNGAAPHQDRARNMSISP